MSKSTSQAPFVQIAVTSDPENLNDRVYAITDNGFVFKYDWGSQSIKGTAGWKQLATRRFSRHIEEEATG